MIKRDITSRLLEDATRASVIAILGPRQSGKTTLVRATFTNHTYISLEDLDMRAFAQQDPRGFLSQHTSGTGIILDEIQHVPDILSYIQTQVDLDYRPGYFILTGSQNFLVLKSVTQTLAGRISLHTLLPLSINELANAELLPTNVEQVLFAGSYPIIYSRHYPPHEWYTDYIRTYIERDVRTITQVTDLSTFRQFVKLCAGRMGQLLNLTSLGNDVGISSNTAKSWISLLEASYIIFLLYPHHNNFNKRLVKTPKLFFYDTGLACSLLDIVTEQQLATHYARGGLFESFVISQLYKGFYNTDITPRLYFWRDKGGHEVDCIIERGSHLIPIEIKAGQTITSSYFDGLRYWSDLSKADPAQGFVVYAGDAHQKRSAGTVLSWRAIDELVKKTLFDKISN